MNILSRYIGVTVLGSVMLVLIVLLGVEIFLELASEIRHVGKGNYTLIQAFINIPLLLPTNTYRLFPMAALIGSLLGLGKLANQSELVVMWASGVSRWQIIRATLQATIIMILFVTVLGEWIAPITQELAKHRKAVAMSAGQSIKTSDGIWYRDNNDFIFIKEIAPNNELRNIARYRVNQKMQLILTSFAENGHYEHGRWRFYNVNQTKIENNNHIISQKIAQQTWDITLDKHLLGLTKLTPDQMSLNKLRAYLSFRHHNGLTAGLYEFEFWKRVIQPIATMVMIFLAIPFIFGPLRSSSMGFRIVAGVIVGFSFYVMNQFFGPLSLVYQIPAFISALLPTLLFAFLGCFLLFSKS